MWNKILQANDKDMITFVNKMIKNWVRGVWIFCSCIGRQIGNLVIDMYIGQREKRLERIKMKKIKHTEINYLDSKVSQIVCLFLNKF